MLDQTDVTGSIAAAAGARQLRRDAIREWLLSKLAEVLAVEPAEIDLDEPLSTYGLGSIAAVTLTGDLETWLGIELSPTLFWEYPTVEGLSVYLDEQAVAREGSGA